MQWLKSLKQFPISHHRSWLSAFFSSFMGWGESADKGWCHSHSVFLLWDTNISTGMRDKNSCVLQWTEELTANKGLWQWQHRAVEKAGLSPWTWSCSRKTNRRHSHAGGKLCQKNQLVKTYGFDQNFPPRNKREYKNHTNPWVRKKLTVGSWHWCVFWEMLRLVWFFLLKSTDQAAAGKSFGYVLHREPKSGTQHCCPKAKGSGRKVSVPNPHTKLLRNHC